MTARQYFTENAKCVYSLVNIIQQRQGTAMRRTESNRLKNAPKPSAISLAALVLCVFFIALSVFSSAYINTHTNHTHDHDGPNGSCETCVHIAVAENLLAFISTAVIGAVLIYKYLSIVASVLKSAHSRAGSYTLVRLKVRLNN
jgi:hypothetical protein